MSGSWLEMLDRDATLAVNNFSGAFTDAVMPVLSNRVVMIPIYLLLIWLLWRRLGWKKTLFVLIAVALAVGATDQFANLIKNTVQRFRPCWDDYMTDNGLRILERRGGSYGFFSAHAATCSAIATSVLWLLRKWGDGRRERLLSGLLVFWVAAVSISRIYVGKHFLGDILVGALAGIIIARVISGIVDWAVNKFFVKFVD